MSKSAFSCLCVLLSLVFILSGCSQHTNDTLYNAYYKSDTGGELVEERLSLSSANADEMAEELFSLLKNPTGNSLIPPVPGSVSLSSVEVSDGVAKLSLSSKYNELNAADKAIFHASVTKTLCSVPEISAVSFICEGSSAQFKEEDFLLSDPHIYQSAQEINLYYADTEFTKLIKKTVTVYSTPSESLEEIALNILLKDPRHPEMKKPIPDGTVLNRVFVSNGICYVDFSMEFVVNAKHSYKNEVVTLYSVVNTLTELPMIDGVQILIDGKTTSGYTYFDISKPLTNAPHLLG